MAGAHPLVIVGVALCSSTSVQGEDLGGHAIDQLPVVRDEHQRPRKVEQRLLQHQRLHASPARSNPETRVLEGEILAGVAKALLYVRPQHRRVLVLRIMHGLSNTEIAEREGLPLATVGTWLRRGREELRRNMRPLLRELGREPR